MPRPPGCTRPVLTASTTASAVLRLNSGLRSQLGPASYKSPLLTPQDEPAVPAAPARPTSAVYTAGGNFQVTTGPLLQSPSPEREDPSAFAHHCIPYTGHSTFPRRQSSQGLGELNLCLQATSWQLHPQMAHS